MNSPFTTGQVARICGVSTRTVHRLIDSGRLPSFKVPNSTHRRVMPGELLKFLEAHGMPTTDPALRDAKVE